MAKKEQRLFVPMVCTVCGLTRRTQKNRTNDPERLVLSLYCKKCRVHTDHKEKKQNSFTAQVVEPK